jgi:hypothetical protein
MARFVNELHKAAAAVACGTERYSPTDLAVKLSNSGVKCDGHEVNALLLRNKVLGTVCLLLTNDFGFYVQRKRESRFIQIRKPNEAHSWSNSPGDPSEL